MEKTISFEVFSAVKDAIASLYCTLKELRLAYNEQDDGTLDIGREAYLQFTGLELDDDPMIFEQIEAL